MKITVLGARGSVPTSGKDMQEFGGATSCVLVETDEAAIFLDAGTGIINTPRIGSRPVSIFLTHPHIDHLLGLPFFPLNDEKGRRIDIYAQKRGTYGAAEQINRLLSPPLWPCGLSDYPADIRPHDLQIPLTVGDVTVTAIESEHPGGSSVFRLTNNKKSIVYATDYEHYEETIGNLIDFSQGADLLLYDGQYTDEESERMRGYGHSTVTVGMRVMEEANVKMLRFVHHDPRHTDEMLRRMEAEVKNDRVAFARQGEVIEL